MRINKTEVEETSNDYTPMSPNRYDYNRNYKHLKDKMGDKATEDGGYMKMEDEDD